MFPQKSTFLRNSPYFMETYIFNVASLLEFSPPNFCASLPSSSTCYVHHPSHRPSSDHSNKIRRREQIMELLISKFLQYFVTTKRTNKQTNKNGFSRFSKTKKTLGGTRWCSWLRHCATGRKVAGSILMVSLEFFIDIILPALLWPWDRLNL